MSCIQYLSAIIAAVGVLVLFLSPNPNDMTTQEMIDETLRKNGVIF